MTHIIEAPKSVDPEFNGEHIFICPRCGSRSIWDVIDDNLLMIGVQCKGMCGDFIMPYSLLCAKPFFLLNPQTQH